MAWQKRARLGVAVFGIAVAIVVYRATGNRARSAPPEPIQRVDPEAVIESQSNVLQQVRGTKQDYLIKAAQQLTYEGGASKLLGVEITVRNRGGRDYVITAKEAAAAEHQQELDLTGEVRLLASDGFEITASQAFFKESDGTVRAPGAFAFRRGRMNGTGLGMLYDKNTDILTITDKATVSLTDEAGATTTEFTAGRAVFTRPEHLLSLDGLLHVTRGEQVIDADKGTTHLSDDDSRVGLIELRGHSQVLGSGHGLDSVTARDIDLRYAADGDTLEHLVLKGEGAVAMSGENGGAGRQIFGDAIDITVAPDGALTNLVGRGGVRLNLAAAADAPARTIEALALDGAGESGKGLTVVRFTDTVVFREEGRRGVAPRTVRSQALSVALAGDAVDSASFAGAVKFEEPGLRASGAAVLYEPANGVVQLRARDSGGGPSVADAQITVEAASIDLALAGRKMTANGSVSTTLRPRVSPPTLGQGPAAPVSKLPGLLKQEQAANVTAESFTYEGGAARAIYQGTATLWQGDTAIRADRITIDQSSGDVLAAGNARSTIVMDTGTSAGRAARITYADALRTITYDARESDTPSGPATPPPASLAQVSGPQGDLRAARIDIVLAKTGGSAERLDAFSSVTIKVDGRAATGARLTYFAAEERYLMTGLGATPVKIVERCGETSGKTLTFFKSADKIIVDGNEQLRTQRTSGGPCGAPGTR